MSVVVFVKFKNDDIFTLVIGTALEKSVSGLLLISIDASPLFFGNKELL